ncbi:uncharacterized protein LOC116224479 [Clupea harengus]|uniref:Uncharacterized protein LOC116224479 n=1 Tax=Clupea harengus TaxID=7950 RepID=A0A6P8GME2_CLUHA|nr:uncharacterized protein LOC116224479 [Clupea harengus]
MKMQSPRILFRSLAIMVIITSVIWAKADAEKFTSCCTAVSDEEVTGPIKAFRIQRPHSHCVLAVIITTDKNEDFCCSVNSPWVDKKYREFMRNLRRTRASRASTPLARLTSSTPSTAFSTDQSPTEGSGQRRLTSSTPSTAFSTDQSPTEGSGHPQSPLFTMQSPMTFFRSLVLITIIASVTWMRADAEKFVSCCTAVSNEEVMDPIVGFRIQKADKHCVAAMILKTENNEDFCCPIRAPWVKTKIVEFMGNLRKERQAKVSTLQRLITSGQKA